MCVSSGLIVKQTCLQAGCATQVTTSGIQSPSVDGVSGGGVEQPVSVCTGRIADTRAVLRMTNTFPTAETTSCLSPVSEAVLYSQNVHELE